MIKWRIYENKNKEKALWTLYTCLDNAIKLLAPFAPYITEEIYQNYFRHEEAAESIHLAAWPNADDNLINEDAEKLGEAAKDIIAAVRQYKSAGKMALNTPLAEAIIDYDVSMIEDDLKGCLKIQKIIQGKAGDLKTENLKIGISIKK